MFVRFMLFVGFLLQCCVVNGQETDSLTSKKINDLWKRNYSGHFSTSIDKKKQETWIKQKIKWMQDSLHIESLEFVEPNIIDIPDLQKISYKLKDCQNIRMTNAENITICVHSAHQDPEIGDVCIGMTGETIFYVNDGHVCGGLINFETTSLILPRNPADFFNFFVSDTDDRKWVESHF